MLRRRISILALAAFLLGAFQLSAPAQTDKQENPFPVGSSVKVLWKGKWYSAKVLQARAQRWHVHYTGYSSKWNEWVGRKRIRAVVAKPEPFPVGSPVFVFWKTKWYKATVMQAKSNSWYVHYVGFSSKWNEWVGRKRIKHR